MDTAFAAIVSMGVGIALSPEILLPGLWIASLKERTLQKSWAYCTGGFIGISIPLVLGFFLVSSAPQGQSLTRAYIRAGLGVALILLGIYVILKKNKNNSREKYAHHINKISPPITAGLGFFVTGLNPKVMPMAISTGHQMSEFQASLTMRIALLLIFFGISMLPFIVPAVLETMNTGFVATIMEPCDRFLEKYGRWVKASILLIIGAIFLNRALNVLL